MPRISLNSPTEKAIRLRIEDYWAEIREGQVTLSFPSRRDSSIIYVVKHTPNYTLCDCSGFTYGERCWHSDFAKEKIHFS